VQDLQPVYQQHEPDGLVILNVLTEDADHDTVEPEDAAEWADVLGLTYPVLCGDHDEFLALYGDGDARDVYHLVSPEGTIVWSWYNHPSDTLEAIEAAIEEQLGL